MFWVRNKKIIFLVHMKHSVVFSYFNIRVPRNISRLFGPRREKTCLRGFQNNTGADQPAQPRSLISAFVICFLECTIRKPASSEISIF